MEERVYFCAAHVQECVTLCDKAQKGLNEDIDAIANLLRFEGVISCTDTAKCRTKSTVFISRYLHSDSNLKKFFMADRSDIVRLQH